jgi:hypothetical protein
MFYIQYFFSPENRAVYEKMSKIWWVREAAGNNMAALWVLD